MSARMRSVSVRARCQDPGRSATAGCFFGFAVPAAFFTAVFSILFKMVSRSRALKA